MRRLTEDRLTGLLFLQFVQKLIDDRSLMEVDVALIRIFTLGPIIEDRFAFGHEETNDKTLLF